MTHLEKCLTIYNMPELPEVETICRALKRNIKSREISNFKIFNKNLRWKISNKIKNFLNNNTITDISRKGKYLLFYFPNGFLIIHLGMTGVLKFLTSHKSLKIDNHDHYQIIFKDGTSIIYNDIRKFGSVHWSSEIKNNFLVKGLGVEPLSKEFDPDYLYRIGKKRRISIKDLIMNQKIVTGVGNIYASESLFLAKIRPNKKSNRLNYENYVNLVSSIKQILKLAIRKGGSSIKDFKTIDGKPGYFSQDLSVYGKESCPSCGISFKLKKIKINGRMSFFCRNCQK